MFAPEGLAEFLSGCDVVVNVAPSTASTRGLLSGDALAACNGAVLVITLTRGHPSLPGPPPSGSALERGRTHVEGAASSAQAGQGYRLVTLLDSHLLNLVAGECWSR
jgi:hypothetical protein